jgi:TetR/AcrR family transcriptional regulator
MTMPRRNSGGPKTANKRAKILQAAEKEFAGKGFAGARMDKIGKSAGLDKATLYYYFRTKQDIYNAVVMEVTQAFIDLSSKGFERDTDPGEELAAFLDILVDFLNKHKSFALILRREFSEPGSKHRSVIYKSLAPLMNRVRDYVYQDIAKGDMRKVDPEHALYSIFEILFGYFTLNSEAAGIFFGKPPYSRAMLQRRKAHLTEVIRRLFAPDKLG